MNSQDSIGSESPDLRERQPVYVGEGEGPGPGGPAGFVVNPGPDHAQGAGQALSEIAEAVSSRSVGIPLKVVLRHYRWDPLLARNLFGFSVYDFDDDGSWIDPFEPGRQLDYAVILNQSVDLQQEIALVFLQQLAFRQRKQAEMRAAGSGVHEIDLRMAEEDVKAQQEVKDRLRYGWKAVADSVQMRMAEAGFALNVEYVADLLDDTQIRRRIPHLRRLYNSFDPVRESVDKLVSMAGHDDPRLGAVGGTSVARDWMQQQTRLWRLRHYQNQALRDAEVCGNGFIAFSLFEPSGPFNLRPEEAVLIDGGVWTDQFRKLGIDPATVTHLVGSRQIDSPYGVSVLEPLVPTLRTLDVFRAASNAAEAIMEDPRAQDEHREWATRTIASFERVRDEAVARMKQLLWFPLEHLPGPAENLYFAGQEGL